MERLPFYLWNRNGAWYYRLPGQKTFHSTGIKADKKINKRRAEQWVLKNKIGKTHVDDMSFIEYADPYFDWDRCPRIRRRLAENKSIGKKHARSGRRLLEKYIFSDRLAQLSMGKIKRGDILDLRDRLLLKVGPATVNRTISAVKAVLSEALFREEIDRDPGSRIGAINYERKEKGVLSVAELRMLFAEIPGVWGDIQTYAVFDTAAKTGMRCGEVLALIWDSIDYGIPSININRAWKDEHEIGLPKWNKSRSIPIAQSVVEVLSTLKEDSIRINSDDLVFCHESTGERLGTTWWRKSFIRAKDRAGIDDRTRRISGHSLRHSLNTHLLSAGCDPFKVRIYLGWSNSLLVPVLTPVQAGYTHFSALDLKDLTSAIERIFSN